MADRYLRSNGAWNGAVWAATFDGAAGSAATPTADDVVYIAANFTVTLTDDSVCRRFRHTNGRINIGTFKLSITGGQFISVGSSARTIDLGSGTLDYSDTGATVSNFELGGSNLNLLAGTSLVVMKISGDHNRFIFKTLSKTFNDVVINIGDSVLNEYAVDMYGSPTFRSLTIQSKNSAAHTVELDANARINVTKFVAIGSSTSNRLKIRNVGSVNAEIVLPENGSFYGQFLDLNYDEDGSVPDIELSNGDAFPSAYAGSNSIGDNTDYIYVNPPKASTLVDEFSTLSSSRWATQAVGSGYVNVSGGTLNMGWVGGSAYTRITSTDSYDLVDDTFYMKVNSSNGGLYMSVVPVAIQGESSTQQGTEILASGERYWRISSTASGDTATLTMGWYDGSTWVDTYTETVPTEQLRSVRFQIDGTRNSNSASLVVDSVGVGPFPTQPEADFSATPTTGKRPVTVNFTDLTKGIPDTWSWDFGDGYTSTQQNPSHPYSKAGTYTVSLTASNSEGTDTVTKTGLVVIQPEIFARSIGGTIKMGAGITSRIVTFVRSIGGTIVIGGSVRAILVQDAEALQSKTFLYKVYNPDGTFVEAWRDVISEPSFTHEINSAGSTMTVELARNSDSLGQVVSPLLTEDGQPIQTEDGQTLLATTTTRNQIGDDSSVNYNNRVDIVVFYGRVEPLYTEDMQPILTEDGEPLLAGIGAPNGRKIFSGFISDINSRYGGTETTTVQLTSFGYDLAQYPVTTSATNDVTTVTFNSTDPSDIVRTAVDRFEERSNLEQLTYTHRTSASISTTGTLVSYTFRNNNYQELLDKSLELMPSNWYYRVGLGDNVVYFRERPTTPRHLFYLGKHIKVLDLRGSILDVVNHTLFTGGGEPALYVQRKENPAPRTRRGLEVRSDSRVTVPLSAQIISDGIIENGNKVQYRTTVEILSGQYDIESIQPGDLVGFRNFGNYVDGLTMQVVGLTYSPDFVQLQLETKPPTINKRLEDVVRNLTVTENIGIPSSPS